MRKQLQALLEREGQAFVGQCCQYALQSKLMQAPFSGGDVLALSWADGSPEEATMAVLLDAEGRVLDQGKFAHLQQRKSPAEWDRLGQWIRERKPALLVVGGTSTATEELYRGLRELTRDLPDTKVIYGDDDTARVYQRGARAAAEFPEYGAGLRYCVSLGRRWLCPLYELAALTPMEAATRLALHPSQALVPPEALTRWITRAFVNVVNLVGIEMARAVASPWVRAALRYVAGLGPLKADALCQALAKV
jgi:transcription elongation factor SPT6